MAVSTRTLLVTGGAGFIGSNFCRLVLEQRKGWKVINYDALTYAGNLENLRDVEKNPNYSFVHGDIRNREAVEHALNKFKCDTIVHFAAESHVDRSIMDSGPFVSTNVLGTQVMLDSARHYWNSSKPANGARFVHIGTDEVYGQLPLDRPNLKFTETTPLQPSSPYSASKTASDLLALAYNHTFGMDVVVTRCSNNFGPYQYPEKVVPLFVTNLLDGKKVPLYGDGKNVRDWLHVIDHCEAILTVLEKGKPGESYIIAGPPHTFLEIMDLAAQISGVPAPKQHPPPGLLNGLAAVMGVIGAVVPLPPAYSGEMLRSIAGVTYLATNAKARRELGYDPRPLADGLAETLAAEMAALGMPSPQLA